MKEQFGLYLILTDPIAGYEACAEAAVTEGLRYLQLRMKDTTPTTHLEMARRLRAITRGTNTRFIVNDDLEIAMEVDADGVHLGQDDMAVDAARATWPKSGKLIGLSTHSLEQAQRALALKPDYIGIGPTFPTTTKLNADPVMGVAEVAHVAASTPVTSVAIGGITPRNLPELLAAGMDNFCVVGAVNQAQNPASAIRELQEIWKRREI